MKQEMIKTIEEIMKKEFSKEQVIDVAIDQMKKIDKIRGYESTLSRKQLNKLDKDLLIECYIKNKITFKI